MTDWRLLRIGKVEVFSRRSQPVVTADLIGGLARVFAIGMLGQFPDMCVIAWVSDPQDGDSRSITRSKF
jgi:hypothetical protein